MTVAEGEQEEKRVFAKTKGAAPSQESFQRLVPLGFDMLGGGVSGRC